MSDELDKIVERLFALDLEEETERIAGGIREALRGKLRKRGLVVAISGGIDSAVCAALSVRAAGPKKVFGLLLPEADSSPESTGRGEALAEALGIEYQEEDVAPVLEAIGCYSRRDEAIRRVFPDYGPGWKNKIVITGQLEGQLNHFRLIVRDEAGEEFSANLRLKEYLQIVAATNFKQRIRKTLEYFHADRLNYAVVGTPNRAEYDQGFFVKNGDGSADLKPIAHLYKSQVYMLARHLEIPKEIRSAKPTTDTYSLPQGQDEFYYALPYREMDIALWHVNEGRPPSDLARILKIDEERASRIYADIEAKRRTTAPLHWPALLLREVTGPRSSPEP
jgi:NAD+ synthase